MCEPLLRTPIPCLAPAPFHSMQVHAPLGVVAVCGRARQGKSYILNRLLKQTGKGFVVGPTHRPCTKARVGGREGRVAVLSNTPPCTKVGRGGGWVEDFANGRQLTRA